MAAKGRSTKEKWGIMIIMSIVTWTLPTLGIPFMNHKVEEFLERNDNITPEQYDTYRFFITIAISFIFLQFEWLIVGFIERLKL